MKFQAIVLASFLVMPYALADDQGGLKQDAAPPPPHAIEDGYRGTDDAKKMTVDFAKTMHDGASVSLRGNLISHKGEDRYVFRDKSGEINVVIPAAVFDGREVQPDQMINPPTKLAQSIRMVIRYFWLTGISRDHAVKHTHQPLVVGIDSLIEI